VPSGFVHPGPLDSLSLQSARGWAPNVSGRPGIPGRPLAADGRRPTADVPSYACSITIGTASTIFGGGTVPSTGSTGGGGGSKPSGGVTSISWYR